MKIIERHLPSKCYSARDMWSIDGAVLHYISAKNVTPNDPFNLDTIIRIFEDYKLSAQYLIDRDGTIYKLVPGMRRAYHAGRSRMNGRDYCNNFAPGIELVGGLDWPYTDEQIIACGNLLTMLMAEHGFTSEWIQAHSRVRQDWNDAHPEKPARIKVDPGDHFPWMRILAMLGGDS